MESKEGVIPKGVWANENWILSRKEGVYLVFPTAEVEPDGVSYVRVVENGQEIAYWASSEWAEDPECVMGAILGATCGGRLAPMKRKEKR